ncbi:MAG: AzlD domain-containing protein [Solirubrobacteraceae bacterium]
MSEAWIAVVVIGAATVALKGAGTVVLGGRTLPERFDGVVVLLAPSLLAGLVVVQTLEGDSGIALDARVAGLAAAVVALVLRAPLLVVLAAAAGVAAAARALGAA